MAGRESAEWHFTTVREVSDVAGGVRRIVMEAPNGVRGRMPPPAGSHIDVIVDIGGRPEVRSYSLVRDGADRDALVLGVKSLERSRGGSAYMHTLRPGARLRISEPLQSFELTMGRPRYLLLAGGIGITALLGMADDLRGVGAEYRVVFAGRAREAMPFATGLLAAHPGRVELAVSEEGTRLDIRRLVAGLPAGTEVYVCGPMRMLEEIRTAWRDDGRPRGALRFETFGSSGLYPAREFRVRVPRLGLSVTVPPETSMLDALHEAGAELMFDCLRGECGLCEVKVLQADGPIDHRDVFLSERERAGNGSLCACVSRVAGGDVTIDVPWRGDAVPRAGTR
ncbi:PDR/VanB family oxidoreductase [Allosalinactinospora lopnorensis]|uniref:PDR/VanB family oxidoreductase n=1 Tax=Allosalinactinospora lopnorensis TaxID=1352348 RepID=UPI000623EE90|nr:PDR/VanB family oxidoreductase [Allosalinactinospora lopnorensis]